MDDGACDSVVRLSLPPFVFVTVSMVVLVVVSGLLDCVVIGTCCTGTGLITEILSMVPSRPWMWMLISGISATASEGRFVLLGRNSTRAPIAMDVNQSVKRKKRSARVQGRRMAGRRYQGFGLGRRGSWGV